MILSAFGLITITKAAGDVHYLVALNLESKLKTVKS
jgi:hypothetical protein